MTDTTLASEAPDEPATPIQALLAQAVLADIDDATDGEAPAPVEPEAGWTIACGDCVAGMEALAAGSVDLVFADPPYNLQIGGDLRRPDQSLVDGVDDAWDKFASFGEYDAFTRAWLGAARRAMHADATIFVIGSYHNIFRVGTILQDMGFWILNDIVWTKTNPMPNFRGRRFTNAHETMIWAAKSKTSRYAFNYEAMKAGNDDVQMRSDWSFPLCGGAERLKDASGAKLHPTQKPEALVRRAIMAASKPGSLVLDPFSGSGTTGACAKALGRAFVGFEREERYAGAARRRLEATAVLPSEALALPVAKRDAAKVPFLGLVEAGLIAAGSSLTDPKGRWRALVRADGTVSCGSHVGSIHQVAARLQGLSACNGWGFWSYERDGVATSIDAARATLRAGAA